VLSRAVLMMIRGDGRARKYVLRMRGGMQVDAGRRCRKLARLMHLMVRYVMGWMGMGWRQEGGRDGRLRVQVGHPRGREIAQIPQISQIPQIAEVVQAGHVVP